MCTFGVTLIPPTRLDRGPIEIRVTSGHILVIWRRTISSPTNRPNSERRLANSVASPSPTSAGSRPTTDSRTPPNQPPLCSSSSTSSRKGNRRLERWRDRASKLSNPAGPISLPRCRRSLAQTASAASAISSTPRRPPDSWASSRRARSRCCPSSTSFVFARSGISVTWLLDCLAIGKAGKSFSCPQPLACGHPNALSHARPITFMLRLPGAFAAADVCRRTRVAEGETLEMLLQSVGRLGGG